MPVFTAIRSKGSRNNSFGDHETSRNTLTFLLIVPYIIDGPVIKINQSDEKNQETPGKSIVMATNGAITIFRHNVPFCPKDEAATTKFQHNRGCRKFWTCDGYGNPKMSTCPHMEVFSPVFGDCVYYRY
jgi:hypothetical protein